MATPVTKLKRPFASPTVSPDGKRVALTLQGETYDIWTLDLERDSLTRLSFGKDEGSPVWSPDGKRVAYQSSQSGAFNVYIRDADGSGAEERLTSGNDPSWPMSFSPDGKLLIFGKSIAGVPEVWVYPFEKGSSPRPFLQGPFPHTEAKLSPDGRWLMYQSNESGKPEVYVTAFPGPGGKWPISTDGGKSAQWAPSGQEVLYWQDKKLMRVAVTTSPTFSAARPELLFEGEYEWWSIAPDGKRFLVVKFESPRSMPKHLNLVLDWFEDLKPRVQAAGGQ